MTSPVSFDRSADAFAELQASEPVVTRVEATLDVEVEPLSAYAALADESDYGFLLESAEKTPSSDPDGAFDPDGAGDRHARYSFVGYDPDAVVSVWPQETEVEDLGGSAAEYVTPNGGDTLDSLREALPDLPRVGFPPRERQQLDGGLVGFLAYDAVYDLWLEEVGVSRPDPIVPDAQFVLTTRTLVFDHAADAVSLVFTPVVTPDDDPHEVYESLVAEAESVAAALDRDEEPTTGGFVRRSERAGPREEYEDAVRRAKEHVLDGDIYQGVISRKRELYGEVDSHAFYRALREVNPSPYMYLLRHGDRSIVGASPETLVSVQGSRIVSNPIAGTCPRGSSPVEDRRLAGEMLADGKERAEHTMLVDLARNDVRRVSEPGSVRVEEFMSVLKYSHVQHIESTVTGTLSEDRDAFDATRATFPAGTLTGAPKIRAMEIIDELEREPRGIYGGGVGYYSWAGDADFAIVIRTATIEHGVSVGETDGDADADEVEDVVTVQAGAGIVADSVPEREYEETEQKMGGVLDALEAIETTGETDDAGGTEPDESTPTEQEASR